MNPLESNVCIWVWLFFNCAYGGPKQRCSVRTPLVVLGLWMSFMLQQAPYRAV